METGKAGGGCAAQSAVDAHHFGKPGRDTQGVLEHEADAPGESPVLEEAPPARQVRLQVFDYADGRAGNGAERT